MSREPAVAGQFYPNDPDDLREMIEYCMNHEFGPGKEDSNSLGENNSSEKKLAGFISPHAGYPYSGMCALHGFCRIKHSDRNDMNSNVNSDINCDKKIDCFVILGFSHRGLDGSRISTSLQTWQMPFGEVEADKEIISKLLKLESVVENDVSIANEHSIEVQIPFIQNFFSDFKIVPLSVPETDFEKTGREIKNVLEDSGKKICIICSSDFTHYGDAFGFSPFKDHVRENIEKLDLTAIDYIKERNANGFIEFIEKTGATICGRNPIALFLNLMRGSGQLLSYYTSGDLSGDFSHSVSYACIGFEE